jgi:hypothetical protein
MIDYHPWGRLSGKTPQTMWGISPHEPEYPQTSEHDQDNEPVVIVHQLTLGPAR